MVATIYSDIVNVTQKTGYRFNSFKILMLNVTLSDMQNKSVLSLALATVYRTPDFLKEFAKSSLPGKLVQSRLPTVTG